MTAIAERFVICLFTITEPDVLGFFSDVGNRSALHNPFEVNILTGEITERLLSSGEATAAPCVAAALLHSHLHGLQVVNMARGGAGRLHTGHLSHGIIKLRGELWPGLLSPSLGWDHRAGSQETLQTETGRFQSGRDQSHSAY